MLGSRIHPDVCRRAPAPARLFDLPGKDSRAPRRLDRGLGIGLCGVSHETPAMPGDHPESNCLPGRRCPPCPDPAPARPSATPPAAPPPAPCRHPDAASAAPPALRGRRRGPRPRCDASALQDCSRPAHGRARSSLPRPAVFRRSVRNSAGRGRRVEGNYVPRAFAAESAEGGCGAGRRSGSRPAARTAKQAGQGSPRARSPAAWRRGSAGSGGSPGAASSRGGSPLGRGRNRPEGRFRANPQRRRGAAQKAVGGATHGVRVAKASFFFAGRGSGYPRPLQSLGRGVGSGDRAVEAQ